MKVIPIGRKKKKKAGENRQLKLPFAACDKCLYKQRLLKLKAMTYILLEGI